MRKLLILLLAAACVGVVISKTRNRGSAEGLPSQDGAASLGQIADGDEAPAAEPGRQPSGKVALRFLRRRAVALRARRAEANGPQRPSPADEAGESPNAPPHAASPVLLSVETTAEDLPAALDTAASLLEAGRSVEARAILSQLYLASRGDVAAKLRNLLDLINRELVFQPRCIEGALIHVVQAGETLTSIGKKYDVNWRMIQRINGMQSDRLRLGQKLKVLTGRTSAVGYTSEFRLALLLDGVYVKEYAIGVGKDDLTPAGRFVVANMLVQPRWYKPGGGLIEYGEEGNLLGERWIGFANEPGASGLGIHGTDDESSIGTKCSNGCIRMSNPDVIELYDFLRPGSQVEIRE